MLRWHRDILRAAGRLKGGRDFEDLYQDGWVSAIARGNTQGVMAKMRESRRYRKRGGMTNHADKLSPGIGEHSDEILRNAGYDEASIRKLRASGAVA